MKSILLLFFLSAFTMLNAQDYLEPVKWSFESEKIGENEYKVKFIAEIEDGWAIYSQFIEEGGPIPTTFAIDTKGGIELIDGVVEPDEKETKYDEMFDMQLTKLKGTVEFSQMVRTNTEDAKVKGFLTFMSCDDTKCLPPSDVNFEIGLK